MSVQWALVLAFAIVVLGLVLWHGTVTTRSVVGSRRALRQTGDEVVRVRVRGIKATAVLVLNDERGRVYRVASKRRGGVVHITYCPPSKRLLRLHVERLAERKPA